MKKEFRPYVFHVRDKRTGVPENISGYDFYSVVKAAVEAIHKIERLHTDIGKAESEYMGEILKFFFRAKPGNFIEINGKFVITLSAAPKRGIAVTVIERAPHGLYYPMTFCRETVSDVMEAVRGYVDQELAELKVDFEPDYAAIEKDIEFGNQGDELPYVFEAGGSEWIVTSRVIEL